jgi:hypothetical protein
METQNEAIFPASPTPTAPASPAAKKLSADERAAAKPWLPAHAYAVGDYVPDGHPGRRGWVCVVAYTSGGNSFVLDREAHPDYWQQHQYVSKAWGEDQSFAVGDIRHDSGNVYWECIVAHKSGPGSFPENREANRAFWRSLPS